MEQWTEYRKDLDNIRSSLLRTDANNDDNEDANEEIDAALEKLSKFTADYS